MYMKIEVENFKTNGEHFILTNSYIEFVISSLRRFF